MQKGLMQIAFENVTSKMISDWPTETKKTYPDLYHWFLTKRG